MYISVADILKQPGLSRDFEYEGPIDICQIELAGAITAKLKITNATSRLIVTGTIRAPVILECSRCAEESKFEINVEVQEEFLPEDSAELRERELNWDNLSLFGYTDDRIEIFEMIRQNILASIPIKPLCREECTGLLEKGIVSLSMEGFSPDEEKTIDPRLLPLMKIKEREDV